MFSLSDPSGGGSLCYVCASQGTFYTAVLPNWPANLMCCNNRCFGKCHNCHVCHNVLFSLLLIQPAQKTPYYRHFLLQVAKYYCSNENTSVAKHKLHNCSPSVLSISAVASNQTHYLVLVATLIISSKLFAYIKSTLFIQCALFFIFLPSQHWAMFLQRTLGALR